MRIIDISVPIRTNMLVYEGDAPVTVTPREDGPSDGRYRISDLVLSTHTGTHVDAPSHFLVNGTHADALPFDALIGAAHVIDATSIGADLDATTIASLGIPPGATRLLFKTPNGRLRSERFDRRYRAITEDGARALVVRGTQLVGIDYLSVAPVRAAAPTHRALLEAGVVILEGLNLRAVEPGSYKLICLPLRIENGDGAPARAVLIDENAPITAAE